MVSSVVGCVETSSCVSDRRNGSFGAMPGVTVSQALAIWNEGWHCDIGSRWCSEHAPILEHNSVATLMMEVIFATDDGTRTLNKLLSVLILPAGSRNKPC